MLEGAVARLLNQLLGKYVVDLDTENLNVGIFSGQVQLTDLKLKTEALYELNLPIEVIAGTVGKIWLQIPWTSLLNQPVVVNIEDVHIVCGPIVRCAPFDEEKNKRLFRAYKRKALNDLLTDRDIIGGPNSFTEHLITNILKNLQFSISNVHIRYEDSVSTKTSLAAGICIGNISAEITNSKWKPSKTNPNSDIVYYLIKIDALSSYWNTNCTPSKWNLPSEYYLWRNSMTSSLQNFSINNQSFEFLLKPMTAKIKMTINKSSNESILKVLSDVIVQDFHVQVSQEQCQSILAVADSMNRMLISWNFLHMRPLQQIGENKREWWRYIYEALLEQRVRPYTWQRIQQARYHYRQYTDIYKKILLNPNDTELKMDLQVYEDKLPIINIVLARQQARLTVHSASIGEKNFWSMLPSPERTLLCEKIGFCPDEVEAKQHIEHLYNIRVGNISLTLTKMDREIAVVTLTQFDISFIPNFTRESYKMNVKVEGLIIEGASLEEHLVPIISSQHLSTSPAYFFKAELEKMNPGSLCSHQLICSLSSVEIVYHKHAFDEIEDFIGRHYFETKIVENTLYNLPAMFQTFLEQKLRQKWELNFDIKIPFIVLPQSGYLKKADSILVMDFGRCSLVTEMCKQNEINESTTQMELEEKIYSTIIFENSDLQVLFCDKNDNWRDAMKEKDTELHVIPRTSFKATYGCCMQHMKTIPRHKVSVNFSSIKINVSERKLTLILKFIENMKRSDTTESIKQIKHKMWPKDKIIGQWKTEYLLHVQNSINLSYTNMKSRKRTIEKNGLLNISEQRKATASFTKNDMNEVWARTVDLPGLEDNVSPNNNILVLLRFVINEFTFAFARSSDSTDRHYLMLRVGIFTTDLALMTYGPAYQISINNILLTDKLHTTSSGQYLDLVYSPFPSNNDVFTVLYRKVDAACPEFWSHFHGVETSLVADFGTLHLLLHQEAIHTIITYFKYINNKVRKKLTPALRKLVPTLKVMGYLLHNARHETPVPPGAVKFSHSARLRDLSVKMCDSDFDIINVHLSGFEMDVLFRANERFVFRSFLSSINVEHLSDVTLYSRVLYTDEDKVYEVKYIKYDPSINQASVVMQNRDNIATNGSFKFHLGQLHITFLYKLFIQLQRFVINVEAVSFVQKTLYFMAKIMRKATHTLKAFTKIQTHINISGPILLFPQKSSSPNVIIVDTGEMTIENFFKECTNEIVENILLKLNGVMVSRGIMTLTASLEMQETIMESANLRTDAKRFIVSKSPQKPTSLSWDITSMVETINITVGQRDICLILCILNDNIGEAEFMELFPTQTDLCDDKCESDESVKALENFFCEPKQKNVNAKFSLDGVVLSLYFDSGELLSSPVRDLNHGLCKLELDDIVTSFTVYTDGSLDGKLSVNAILIEEIGPICNVPERQILIAPTDDDRSSNCNITVNKPPIVDVTFHKNKSEDRTADIIIGKMSLILSVPFCEKLALFIIECTPKENLDRGIVNLGYVGETKGAEENYKLSSLTVALRINKPEFIFLIETASNKKRYFITKCEILSDYSHHNNGLNFIISLSGLHTLFYDFGMYSVDPYMVLKHCDVELSICASKEKGNKITLSISSIYVQICSRVVHSIEDILNDIAEHFKVPEEHFIAAREKRKSNAEIIDTEDLWEPKKLLEYVPNHDEEHEISSFNKEVIHEILLIPKLEIVLVLEMHEIQVFCFKSTLEVTVYDWSSLLNSTCEFTIQANYYNPACDAWEPLIDPVVLDECEYKPWDVLIKVFQDKSVPIMQTSDKKTKKDGKLKKNKSLTATEDEEDSADDMVYIEPAKMLYNRTNNRIKTSLSAFLDDSDSENEDCTMERLATAISDLFTGDWNESEDSECDHSTDTSDDSDNEKSNAQNTVNLKQQKSCKQSTYIIIDAKEKLDLTVTPALIKLVNELLIVYSNKTLSVCSSNHSINLVNDIGPQSKTELFETLDFSENGKKILICSKTYENQDSCPNSPCKQMFMTSGFSEDTNEDRDSLTDDLHKADMEFNYNFEAVSSLQFPLTTTAQLFENVNKYQLKVQVPGLNSFQTNCSNRNWEKIVRVQATDSNLAYHLALRHIVGKDGRTIVISSPLQIRNETCFALSILYQPSILQQLNLEPVGEVTNPFETTMRIAVLEPHEHYNVPLYIAYHCKLFIQPAYAEGHYASDCGIWWQDLLIDLDAAHNFHCNPKCNSNLEVFSLRIKLQRNINQKNSHAHSIPNYIIRILPPLILYNFLPYCVEVQNTDLKQHIKVDPGEKNSVYSLDLTKERKLTIKMKYDGIMWTGTLNFTSQLEEKIVVLSADEKCGKQMLINVKVERENSCNLYLYTAYWIVNKTGLPLHIKGSSSNIIQESSNENTIILFTYKRHGKQTLTIKVYDSEWSSEFGLECAGTSGLIVCKHSERKRRYAILQSIKLSEMCPKLTKIITLLPSFLVYNNTHHFLRFMEHNEKTDLWIDLPPNQCVTFWPETNTMQMYVKYRESKLQSHAFYITNTHRSVLRMDKGAALCVDVSGGKLDPFKICFQEYKHGDAPILIKNYCTDLFLKIQQQGQGQVTLVNPCNSLLYTWDDPLRPRLLVWNIYNNKGSGFVVDILKDGYGEQRINLRTVTPGTNGVSSSSSEDSDTSDSAKTTLNNKVRRDKIVIYWLCYRDGLQKTLVFTQEQRIATHIIKTKFLEFCDTECFVSVAGVGVSIFTNKDLKREHMYFSILDIPAIWEVNIGHKWKVLTLELASWIEDKYRLHYKKCQLKDYIQTDFEKMFMLKPFFAELRRTYTPGIYIQYRKSKNYDYFNFKLQYLQVDNKHSNSQSSVILYPLPSENVRAQNSFMEMNIFKNSFKGCNIYKLIRIHLSDFHLNLEDRLFVHLHNLFYKNGKFSKETTSNLYRKDLSSIHSPVFHCSKGVQHETIVENVQLFRINIQLNICKTIHLYLNNIHMTAFAFLNYIFPITMSPYIQSEGVLLKITPLEVIDTRTSFWDILASDLFGHVKLHFLQQYYSQILGLQVLLNPYYTQGIASNENIGCDAEKCANILFFGCRCLLGHINMSPAALEQCITDIFTNQNIENIQRIRRHGSYQKSGTVPKSITISSKDFKTGVPLVVDQLIAKGFNGSAYCNGELFFRGVGKALLSLITRHQDDKSNSVQVACEALRRASLLGEPVRIHQRPTRYCNSYLGMKPFSIYESIGHHLLQTIGNSRFINDTYWAHAAVDKSGKSLVLVSLEHVIRANKCGLWGPWELEWCMDLDDINSMPKLTPNELVFNIRQNATSSTQFTGNLAISGEKEVLNWLQEKIQQAIIVSMEDKSWPMSEIA